MGKLIVVDGLDGTGKKTQFELLYERLKNEDYNPEILDFPQYDKNSSVFVRNYLSGDYGTDPNSVSPYQASLCFAMDRFDCFKRNPNLKTKLNSENSFFLSNRYTTSNMIFHAAKMETEKIPEFLNWIENLEYNILEIPRPSDVFLFQMPIDFSLELMRKRNITQTAKKNNMLTDIHESNELYLRSVAEKLLLIAKLQGFHVLNCIENGNLRTKEDIHEEIYSLVKKNN